MWSDLLGKDFAYGAKGPQAYDCYGLAQEVWRRLGKSLPDQYPSTDMPECNDHSIEDGVGMLTKVDGPQPGALVTFRMVPPWVSHLGVMLDRTRFIHILSKRSVTIERIDNVYWRGKVAGYYV